MSDTPLNSTFRQFAHMFLGRTHVDEDIPFAHTLDRASLDGSIESLTIVDRYLAHVQSRLDSLTEKEYSNIALRCGAYVGECIRMTWPEAYDWTDYNAYVPNRPELQAAMPRRTLENSAILVRKPDCLIMPVNTVIRFLQAGPENSVVSFAESERQYHEGK
jgi:hypothetical protein